MPRPGRLARSSCAWDTHLHACVCPQGRGRVPAQAAPGEETPAPRVSHCTRSRERHAPALRDGQRLRAELPPCFRTGYAAHAQRGSQAPPQLHLGSPSPRSPLPTDPRQLQRTALQPPPCPPLLAPTASTQTRSPPARPRVQQPRVRHRPGQVPGASAVAGGSSWELGAAEARRRYMLNNNGEFPRALVFLMVD